MIEETEDEYRRIIGNSDPLDKLNELALTINEHYFDVGCVLYHLKETDTYKTIEGNKYYSDKHTKWKAFCEEKLSISYRTAQYWLNLYRYFSEMGIAREKLANLGWSKAKELIDVTEDPVILDQILEAAPDMTIAQLQAYIQDFKVDVDGEAETVSFKKFTFSLPAAMSEHAQEVVNAAARECGNDLNEGFFKILIEWYQIKNPLPEGSENMFLVSDDTLDDFGQELPEEVQKLFI